MPQLPFSLNNTAPEPLMQIALPSNAFQLHTTQQLRLWIQPDCWLWLHKKAIFSSFFNLGLYTYIHSREAANYCQIREKSEFFWYLLVQSEDRGLLQSSLCEVLWCVSSKRSQSVLVFSNLQSLWISPLLSHSVLTGMSSSLTVCNSQEMDGVEFFYLRMWIYIYILWMIYAQKSDSR